MSTLSLSELLSLVVIQGQVTDQHVSDFRKIYFEDGKISLEEVDSLFEVNNLSDKPDSWTDLFIDAIAAFLVHQTMPLGYINEANAAWLMARITQDGQVEARTEIELLLRVMKVAKNVTPSLERFALNQVKEKVLAHGNGIGETDVEMLRRVLYACSSEGGISITRNEAEALFDLNDACTGMDNHPSWEKLFVGATANHLMMVAAWNEPDLKEALRREKWLEEPARGFVLPNISALLKSGRSIFSSPKAEFTHMDADAVTSAEKVDANEAEWLIERLNRDGHLNANEQALLRFLEEECPDIHGSLMPLIKAA